MIEVQVHAHAFVVPKYSLENDLTVLEYLRSEHHATFNNQHQRIPCANFKWFDVTVHDAYMNQKEKGLRSAELKKKRSWK